MARRFQLAAFSLSILAVAAAGAALEFGSTPSPAEAPSKLPAVSSAFPSAEPVSVISGQSNAALPVPGSFELSDDGRRLGLVANGAPRKAIVRALGTARDITVSDTSLDDPTVDISISDSSIEQVLAVLMAETPYQLDYELDSDLGMARPARLRVGDTADTASTVAVRTNPAGQPKPVRSPEKEQQRLWRDAQREALVANQARPSAEYRQAVLEAREEREDQRREARLARLEKAEVQEVVGELWKLDPSDPSEQAFLVERLKSSNVGLRVAAARQLEFARGETASKALRAALADPHPLVVKTAIDSLRTQGSRDVIDEVAPLRQHADPTVRASAERAISKLR